MIIDNKFINSLVIFGDSLCEDITSIQNKVFNVELKSDNSPLTEADLLSNKKIQEFLKANSTVQNFISEEEKKTDFEIRKNWDYYWVIDPIDGTKEFVKGGDDYCVNIALCKGSEPVFGYVLRPKTKDHYYAVEHQGAFKNGRRIKCTENLQSKIRVVASKSHINQDTEDFINHLSKLQAKEIETVNIGSALKLCLIAEGKADVYPRYGPTMEWDTCAPHIIAKEAGGIIFQANPTGNRPELLYNKENLLNPYFICCSKSFLSLLS